MRRSHSSWREMAEEMELLQSNPREFVRKRGFLYDVAEPKKRSIFHPFF